MESSGGEKQNESDECDVNGDNRSERGDDTTPGRKGADPRTKAEDNEREERTPRSMNPNESENGGVEGGGGTKGGPKTQSSSTSVDEEEADEEDERSKASVDEEERKEVVTKTDGGGGEKKEEESSSDTTSTSTSDDESETSSEDKTEPSKPTETTGTMEEDTARAETGTKEESKDNSKNEDTTDDSDIEDDLISAINYNTITSLAALKDMLQSSGEDSDGVDSFFHHYFLSHVNRLPSRNQTHSPYPWGRRLSECREEDEYETEEGERGRLFFFSFLFFPLLPASSRYFRELRSRVDRA